VFDLPSVLIADILECGYSGGFTLRNVKLSVSEGEILLVTGRSGSGKTTLVRAITGTMRALGGYVKGEVYLCGRNVQSASPEDMYSCLTYIPQEPWYAILGHTVYAEICHVLALEGYICSEVEFALSNLSHLANRLTYTLSAGETQRVLWAEALLKKSRLLVLDEPLVYLDRSAKTSVKRFVEKALGEDLSVLLVDHDPVFWEDFEPQLLYLRDGRVMYYGGWSRSIIEQHSANVLIQREARIGKGVYAELRNVWFKYPGGDYVLKNVNMKIERGVLTAITGPNGSGKTTLLKLASGILKPNRGIIVKHGTAVYIPENPLLYFTMPTPREELLIASKGDESRMLDIAEYFNITSILDQPLAKLSSGERRRIALASAYLSGFDAYFVDEPTGGLDYESAMLVLNVLEDLVERDRTVIIATHDERAVSRSDLIVELGI
jgi:energy-coupling factor transport system ATP-binding protein